MLKTPVPRTTETEADRFFAYLASHVKRSPDTQRIATIDPSQSARTTWTTPQVTILGILTTLTIVALWSFGISVLTLLFALVTILYVAMLCLSVAWMMAVARRIPQAPFDPLIIEELRNAPWPRYTILCPLYKEQAVVRQFVQAMQHMDYPTDCLQVLFLTEEDDQQTRNALLALNLPAHFEVVTVPQGTPKTKPRACNWGLQMATGEYCVIFDAEDIPDPQQLKKAILTFASTDVNVACVQAKLNFYNPTQNLLTRWFTIEYSLWFDLILPGLQALGFSLPLGGTSNHFRVSALKALGGWDAYNVTEDCDLGLKLAKYQFRTIMLESTTYEEANSRTMSWIRQRSRWIKGYMQTYLVHTRHPLKEIRRGKIKDLLSLHLFVGAGSIVLLINPIMWAMFAAYLIWRPVDLYHQLFPWPVLYAGMLCFLVGNFLPIYVSMIACVKREQYNLVKWCLLLPLYWILASIASFLAGYELIVKPHHWHKTQHGLHLKDKKSTAKVKAIQMAGKATVAVKTVQPMGTVTQSVRAMTTLPVPAITIKRRGKKITSRDPWLLATLLLACVCSVAATTYFFQHHDIIIYNDAFSHLENSRRVFDSVTPGLAQLGAIWLPLPHILMWPFIWNDFLWRTGLAGSLPAMICYIISSVYVYLFCLRIIKLKFISFIGALCFILNPNILYLQSTPLSELSCIVTSIIACYYFLRWTQEGKNKNLIFSATFTFLSTISRYDGWFLFIAIFSSLVVITLLKAKKNRINISNIILFSFPGGLGIILWFIWNWAIMGNPFYFKDSPFSAQSQQKQILDMHQLYTYHSLMKSLQYYISDMVSTSGLVITLIAMIGLVIFLASRYKKEEVFGILVLLTPFVFYVFTLYLGQSVLYVANEVPKDSYWKLFNTRYASQMVYPLAILTSVTFTYAMVFISRYAHKYMKSVFIILFLTITIYQSYSINSYGIISLEAGKYGLDCTSVQKTDVYLSSYYDGTMILDDTYSQNQLDVSQIGGDYSKVIYLGSYKIFNIAISNPSQYADWILIDSSTAGHQRVDTESIAFKKTYSLVSGDPKGIALYHKISIPLNEHKPSPYYNQYDFSLCKAH